MVNPRRALPPSGNYGGGTYKAQEYSAHEAQSSSLAAQEGAVLLDYLRCRLPDTRETWEGLRSWLGPMTARAVGWRGWYDQSFYVLDGGIVACCSDRERAAVEGVLLDLPGKACAHLGEKLIPFCRWCADHGTFTRGDFAIDDRKGNVTLERIVEADEAGAIVTRWQGLTVVENRQRGRREGWTVYIGSRSSEAFMRFYDKAAEQKQKLDGHWVRCELECKGDLADSLMRDVLNRGAVAVIEQINRRIRFVEPSATDSNTRRAKVADWWQLFIGSIKQGASLLCGEKVQATVEAMAQWVERQAGPALACIVKAAGDMGLVLGIIDRGERRLKPKHHAALALAGLGAT